MENSKIEWTDHTFNPWIGCTKVSPGCANCYAETLMDNRFKRVQWGMGNPRKRTGRDSWSKPRQWDLAAEGAAERPRVFCASLADWLDEEAPLEWQTDLLNLIHKTPNLDWLLLSKRLEELMPLLGRVCDALLIEAERKNLPLIRWVSNWINGVPPKNIWIGTSAEDQKRWDQRVPILMDTPARVRFVSAEPLLGPIRMGDNLRPDWLIVGGESGEGARPMEAKWVTDLRDQCDERTAFHFKQWGGPDKRLTGRELDGRTWDEFPQPLISSI